jgi:predicted phosphodiesterase
MRVAVMSDIHGFNLALETVIDDLREQGPFDAVVVAGDLCEVGPGPADVIELLQAQDDHWIILQGNTDRDIVEAARYSIGRSGMDYTIEQIGREGVDYLAALPFSHRITPPGGASPDDDLFVFHANPFNLEDRLDPSWSDTELKSVLRDARAKAVAFGHIHIAYIRQVDGTLLVDVSAVGNPKDGDLRCKYGILTWDDSARTWNAELRRLPYPLDETEDQILASTLSNPEKTLKKLKKASY